MADRTGVDFVQQTIGNSFQSLLDYYSYEPFVGINNDWFVLYTRTFGSLDYFHLVSFPLSGLANYPHPLFLNGFNDNVVFGYINCDLTNEGRDSHLYPTGAFDVDWCPCPNGTSTYPAWNGWPLTNIALPNYPIYNAAQMIVLLKGLCLKVNSSINAVYTKTFQFTDAKIISETLRPTDKYDIRVYRFTTVDGSDEPAGVVFEVPRKISGNNIIIQVGLNGAHDLNTTDSCYYMIYWQSPDALAGTSPPVDTFTIDDITSSLTFNDGDTPLARELFNVNRYDLVNFKNLGPQYVKNYFTTYYDMIDGSPQHYDDPNPIFYRLPAMQGTLDPFITYNLPTIGNVWGYGYSIDRGILNPGSDEVQGVVICYKTSAGEATDMQVLLGPVVPSEFQPDKWTDFEWYPPVLDDYVLFAKLIVKVLLDVHQTSYRPSSFVEYMEYTQSYGDELIKNESFISSMYEYIYDNKDIQNFIPFIVPILMLPILTLTPVVADLTGGMIYNAKSLITNIDNFSKLDMYWKSPTLHPVTPHTPYVPTDNLYQYITNNLISDYQQLEFSEGLRSVMANYIGSQLSTILATFYADDTNLNFGTNCYNNKKVYVPTPLELNFPIANSCNEYIIVPELSYDYSLRFKLRSARNDSIRKDLFLSASKYWVTDDESLTLVNPDMYLWPAKLATMDQWVMYGRSVLIPDAMSGENHPIQMRQFKPRNPALPLYDEFVAALNLQYYDDLHSGDPIRINRANQAIADAITNQEYVYGGFDEPDTRTLTNLIYSMDELIMAVSLYNTSGVPNWQSTINFWGGDPAYFDKLTGVIPRWGFKVNNDWYNQSFTQNDITVSRFDYINTHPESIYILQKQENYAGSTSEFSLNDTNFSLATTFIADFAGAYDKVYKVKLKLKLNGVPTARMMVTINTTDIATKKPLSVMQTSDIVNYEQLGGDFTWIEFNFTSPNSLTKNDRYAIVLVVENPFSIDIGVDATNYIEWAYADNSVHSYGITDISSFLTTAAIIGDTTIYVADAATIFGSAPFYIKIGDEIKQVVTSSGNILDLSSALSNDYVVNEAVYQVIYVPTDAEVRWIYQSDGSGGYEWIVPTNPTYDATYQLYRYVDVVGLVVNVPPEEWSGTDLVVILPTVDAFYIARASDSYILNSSGAMFYGFLSGLEPFAGFNVANSYDFPAVNTWRAGYTNLVDGYIGWTSKRLNVPEQFKIFPLAIDNSGVQYLPTEHDMYIIAVCVKWDNSKKVVKLLLPAGTAVPTLLDADEFIGIDLLWVDRYTFKSEPFYGYGPAEAFVVRSV